MTPEQAKKQDALRQHKKAGSRRGNKVATVPTFTADIYTAGDLDAARAALSRYCLDVGLCVTLTATDFVYEGGMESGIRVGLINYPRFPKTPAEIRTQALNVAMILRQALCQHSYTIVMPNETIWNSLRNEPPTPAHDDGADPLASPIP